MAELFSGEHYVDFELREPVVEVAPQLDAEPAPYLVPAHWLGPVALFALSHDGELVEREAA